MSVATPARGRRRGVQRSASGERHRRWFPIYILPAALVLILVLPTFSFPYLYDDYDFLGRAQTFRLTHLLPDSTTLFYRPLSREIYFGALAMVDPSQPLWGHLGNALLLALAVSLLVSLVSAIVGVEAGFLAGAAFACLGALPALVGWVSCVQDLLAIVFVLAALNLQLSGRLLPALFATAGALLSKETAVAFLPSIALLRWLLGRTPHHAGRSAASLGLLTAVWAATHPGVRRLFVQGLESTETAPAYLTITGADRWGSLGRNVLALFNVPIPGAPIEWPSDLGVTLVVGASVLIAGLALARRADGKAPGPTTSPARILWLGALLSVPPLLLISWMVRHWELYYVCLAALGSSLLLAFALSRLPVWLAGASILAFLALGVWCRGMDLGPGVPTERSLRPSSERLRRAQSALRALRPKLDAPAQVYISVLAPEEKILPVHLFRFQALRAWYRSPSIDTMHPEWRRPSPAAEYLFWVGADLSVHEIDTRTLKMRSAGPEGSRAEYCATLRAYAQGLAGSGMPDRGVEVLLRTQVGDEYEAVYNRRLAAALLLAEGREGDAERVLRGAPTFTVEDAVDAAGRLVANPSRRDLDRPLLAAMGLSSDAAEDVRAVMRWLAMNRSRTATIRFARRLLTMLPGDPEAEAVLRILGTGVERLTVPVVPDSLW